MAEPTFRELQQQYLAECVEEIAKNVAADFFGRSPKYRSKVYLESDIRSACINVLARANVYLKG